MRIAITILAALVVAVVGGAFLLSRLIAAEELRAEIVEESEALAGSPLQIEGGIDLSLLPSPTLSFSNARFLAPNAGDGLLEVDRVDLGVGVLALLAGRVEVEDVRLVRPRLTLNRPAGRPASLFDALAAQMLGPARAGLGRLSVVDGRAVVGTTDGPPGEPALLVERIDLEVEARSDRGPFLIEGGFVHGGEGWAVEATLGRLTADPATTLQLALGTVGDASFALAMTYRGIVRLSAPFGVDGQLQASGDDLAAAARSLAPAGWLPADLPSDHPSLGLPFDLRASLERDSDSLRLGDLRLVLAGVEASGALEVDPAARSFALALDVARLAMDGEAPLEAAALGSLLPLVTGLEGTVDLTLGQLVRGDAAARATRVALVLQPPDRVLVRQLRSVLPGDTDLAFEGVLRTSDGPTLAGRVRLVTDRLGETLLWLGQADDPGRLAGLRAMSLDGDLAWSGGAVRLTDAEARIDASRVEGDLAVATGARPSVDARLEVDRLALDTYLPDASADRTFAALVDGILRVDLDMDVRIARLVQGGARFDGVEVRARAEDGRLEVDRLRATTFAATSFEGTGSIDARGERARLQATVGSDEPGPLLRRLGADLPVSLARFERLQADMTVAGWSDTLTVDVTGSLDDGRFRAAGTVGRADPGDMLADLEVGIGHPSYAALLRSLGLAGEPTAATDAPVDGAGQIRLAAGDGLVVKGHLALGTTRITGQVARLGSPSDPSWEMRLSLAEPALDALLPLTVLAGYRFDRRLSGPVLGAWPDHPIPVGRLRSLKGRLAISGKGGLAGGGLEAELSGEGDRIVLDSLAVRMSGGETEVTGTLELAERAPALSLLLDVRDVRLGSLLETLGVPPGTRGQLDLFGRVDAIGATPYELVRGLRGELTFSVDDGEVLLPGRGTGKELVAQPLALLEGRTEIARGAAALERLDVETADGLWRGDGVVDLLLWITDLTLEDAEADGRTVRIVGRPDDPQVLVRTGAAAPAE